LVAELKLAQMQYEN